MKIVLIAYHFPPDRAVGGQRAAKVAQAWARRGHAVQVVTARLPDETSVRETGNDIKVSTARPWPGPRDVWAWWRKTTGSAKASSASTVPATSLTPARKPAWKRFLLSLIWLPDDRQGFVVPALFASLGRATRGADLIYSTAPPFSGHLVALLLHYISRKKLVIEFRDPWIGNPWKSEDLKTHFSDAIERWLERRCVRAAFRVVSVSDGINRRLLAKYGDRDPHKFMVVRNGIDLLLPLKASKRVNGPVQIVYVGTFYMDRDPRPFLRALSEVKRAGQHTFRVSLVGQCRFFSGHSIEHEVNSLGLSDDVHFLDWVDRKECDTIVESADLLLLLAQNQPDQIPNKLYEYLGTRTPILAFADEEGESAKMLAAVGGHVVVSANDSDTITRKVMQALSLSKDPGTIANEVILKEWTTKTQMDTLISSLEADLEYKR
jgi:glycosyltransferase involved in cell wall biosynthesis